MTLSFWLYPIFVCSFTYVSVEVSETFSWMLNVLFPQEVLFERYPFFFSLVALFYWTSMRILMGRSWLDVGSMLGRWLWWWWCVFVGSLLAQGWLDLGSRLRLAQCMANMLCVMHDTYGVHECHALHVRQVPYVHLAWHVHSILIDDGIVPCWIYIFGPGMYIYIYIYILSLLIFDFCGL